MKSKLSLQFLAATIVAVLMSLGPAAAQRVSDIELLLREALHKQQVEGDLPGAIKLYQQIVATRNGNRVVVSKALLELAGCYEKLGQQAETVYQQIVRDYADQPAASQARAKLAALRPPAPPPTMTLRQIEFGEGINDIVDGDDKRAVYWDSTRTRLFFGDIAGKTKPLLILETKAAPRAVVSRDLSMVFLYFPLSAQGGPEKFAIVKTDGTGYRELEFTDNGKPLQVLGLGPSCASWSWDNRYLLLCKPESAGTRLLKLSVADLKVQDLLPGKPVVGRRVRVAEFSPDGRYIAYGGGPTYIIPAQGGDSRLLAAGGLVDWSADGRYAIIGEPRAGAMVLDAVPVTAGQPSGESIALRSVPGPILFARTMPNGALLFAQQPQDIRAISLGVLDANEKVTWSRLDLIGLRLSTPVAWSPEGSRFAYVSGVFGSTTRVVRIKDLASDDDRELFRRDSALPGCTWAHHQSTIYCTQSLETKTNILSVSESGSVEVIGSLAGQKTWVQITSDDRKLVLNRSGTVDWVEWDIATGLEKTVSFMRSTDGRWSLGRIMTPGRPGVMTIRPAAGTDSDWRPLVVRRIPPGAGPIPTVFSSDGKWVIYHDRDMDGKDGLYRVATEGSGEPERLGDYPTSSPSSVLSVSRDGRKFVVNAPKPFQLEAWILENFLPVTPLTATPAAKPGAR